MNRRQNIVVQADDVILTNIRENARNGIDFNMYVQTSGGNMVLNLQALTNAVVVRKLVGI